MYVTITNFDKQFENIDNIYLVENNQPGDGKIYTFAATPRWQQQPLKPKYRMQYVPVG
jgi:putative ABC transport system permease protein